MRTLVTSNYGALLLALIFLSSGSFHSRIEAAAASTVQVAGTDSSLAQTFRNRLASRYFMFYSDLPLEHLRWYGSACDLFVDAIDREFFRVQPQPAINVYISPDKQHMQNLLKTRLGIIDPPSFGMYLPDVNGIFTYPEAGIGTFTHEIMHPLVERNLPFRPAWAHEGLPAFFEKFYGYKEGGRLHASWGYQNPWRVRAIGNRLRHLDLRTVILVSQDVSELRLVSVFLYQQGRLNAFLEAVKQNDRGGYETFVEAAFRRPLSDIEPLWKTYLADIERRMDDILRLPSTSILETKSAYDAFRVKHAFPETP